MSDSPDFRQGMLRTPRFRVKRQKMARANCDESNFDALDYDYLVIEREIEGRLEARVAALETGGV